MQTRSSDEKAVRLPARLSVIQFSDLKNANSETFCVITAESSLHLRLDLSYRLPACVHVNSRWHHIVEKVIDLGFLFHQLTRSVFHHRFQVARVFSTLLCFQCCSW